MKPSKMSSTARLELKSPTSLGKVPSDGSKLRRPVYSSRSCAGLFSLKFQNSGIVLGRFSRVVFRPAGRLGRFLLTGHDMGESWFGHDGIFSTSLQDVMDEHKWSRGDCDSGLVRGLVFCLSILFSLREHLPRTGTSHGIFEPRRSIPEDWWDD